MNLDLDFSIIFSCVLLCHFIGDFLLQHGWMARNKSKCWATLITHSLCYTFPFMCLHFIYLGAYNYPSTYFGPFVILHFIVCISHLAQDAITSQITSFYHDKMENAIVVECKEEYSRNFWVMIGFDQFLHILTLYWLFSWAFS